MKFIIYFLIIIQIESYFDLYTITNIVKTKDSNNKNYIINKGQTIDEINKKYRNLLVKKPNYSIYCPTITFSEFNNYYLSGLNNYKYINNIFLSINYILPINHYIKYKIYVENDVIKVRWKIVYSLKNQIECYEIEAISNYFLDENGKIYYHKLDKTLPNNMKGQKLILKNHIDSLFKQYPYPILEYNKKNHLDQQIFSKYNIKTEKNLKVGEMCISSSECQDPFQCCNFIVYSICCIDGGLIPILPDRILVPIPIEK